MPRIAGVEVPKNKRGEIALTYIYGIGRNLSKQILTQAKIDFNKKASDWTDGESNAIRKIIDQNHTTGGNLRTKVLLNIKRLKDIACYRGIRHRMGLPVNGQNTKNNARTRKGKGAPIANKRKNTK
ncbi:MAG: 30S ribosomal protein S13 [Bacteroidota bacterium]